MWRRDVRGAPEGSTSTRLIGARSCPSQQSLRPRRLLRRKPLRWLCCSLHVEPHNSVSISEGRQDAPLHKTKTKHNFTCRKLFSVWAQHDVQEAEEGELQRAGLWTSIPGQRHLFPLVKVRQLQDDGFTEQLLRGLQLQDSGLFWRDSAQKLQKGKHKTFENTFFFPPELSPHSFLA